MPYVYSTLTSDNRYTIYANGGGDLKVARHDILIKGGTGIADKNLITPIGVATQISDEDAALLKEHPVFKLHEANGFVVIDDKKHEAEKVASNGMEIADGSAPVTEAEVKPKRGRKTAEELTVSTSSDDE